MLHLVVTSVHCLSFQVEQRDFFGLFFSLCTGPIHDRQPLTLRRDNKLIIWRMPCSQGAALRLFRRRRFSPQNLVFPFAHQMKSIHLSRTSLFPHTHSVPHLPFSPNTHDGSSFALCLLSAPIYLHSHSESIHNLWGENVKRELLGYSMQIAAVNE